VAVQFQWQFSFSGNSCVAKHHLAAKNLRTLGSPKADSGQISIGLSFAPDKGMKEPSAKRKRTLALHERAIQFSVNVNTCCPQCFSNEPSKVVWGQLVRAADSTSNNLVEADDGVSDADFLNKMGTALKEAKESRVALVKLRLGNLDNCHKTARLELESEARQLSAIFSTIIRNMEARLQREKEEAKRSRSRRAEKTETETET